MSMNEMIESTTSKKVLDTLENLIAPGGRARLSPYIETAQIHSLFGELPDPENKRESISRLIEKNNERIISWANRWTKEYQKDSLFRSQNYQDPEYLSTYLLYYFSTNVAKIQLVLLDLVRDGIINDRLDILDLGVGTGTTAVAVFDFIFNWRVVCDLYGVVFPIETISYQGMDCIPEILSFSSLVLDCYRLAITERTGKGYQDLIAKICRSIEDIRWIEADIGAPGFQIPDDVNCIVLGNVINELSPTNRKGLTDILEIVDDGTLIVAVEPGDKKKSRSLMTWRRDLFNRGGWKTGPCGTAQESLRECCEHCWNSRRYSFHQPLVYLAFRNEVNRLIGDNRSFDQYQNSLLSWSSVWLLKRRLTDNSNIEKSSASELEQLPDKTVLTYIGSYTGNNGRHEPGPIGYGPDEFSSPGGQGWREFIKFCPANIDSRGLTLIREPGFEIPNLRHGDQVKISGSKLSKQNHYSELILDNESQIISIDQISSADGFLDRYDPSSENAVNEISYRLFGFPELYQFQHRILKRVMRGRSILGIAATGSGKSECFILPAMLLPGMTIVVSPLLSLMMDQYDQRISDRYGLGNLATFINGEVPFKERRARLKRMELGFYKLVYFTPEQLERGYILESLQRADQRIGIRYLAMDEAHCISQWGHDFRPSYLNLKKRLMDYEINPVRIALTATASPYVRKDICDELSLDGSTLTDGGDLLVESSNRAELNLIVKTHRNTDDKVEEIVGEVKGLISENRNNNSPGASIIFLPTTGGDPDLPRYDQFTAKTGKYSTGVTYFGSYLERRLQQRVSIYHSKMEIAGFTCEEHTNEEKDFGDLSGRTRRQEQESFIFGERDIMVATKGFGMGIDKENIRVIIHRTPPGSLEAYAQEAGRAGRDGNPANVILHYSPDVPNEESYYSHSDYDIQRYFLEERYVREEDIRVMLEFLRQIPRRISETIYFTNDQAIGFFDDYQAIPGFSEVDFSWPEFEERRIYQTESLEHKEILDRGWTYQKKTDYINKILQVLHKVRPVINGSHKLSFVDSVAETGIRIKSPRVINASAILTSNSYFGEIIRNRFKSTKEFIDLVESETIERLARTLGINIRETALLLSDIREADGRFVGDTWLPSLIDFKGIFPPKWGPAEGNKSLSSWRNYAGAFKRATSSVASMRAKNHNGQKNINDWFSWSELNLNKGWEIKPGDAIYNLGEFEEYVRSFVELHKARERNDWASYNRMLTGYLGVQENGELHRHSTEQECLRSVLLGYLDTNEVVVGDSCYSCSRCVPDLRFDRYSMDEKRAVVVRMTPDLSRILDEFSGYDKEIPSDDQIELLVEHVEREKLAGRSFIGYFNGWSARLLDQMPGHLTGMWLRILFMMEGYLRLQVEEILGYLDILVGLPQETVKRFSGLLHTDRPELTGSGDWNRCLARLAEKLGDFKSAMDYYQKALDLYVEQPVPDGEKIWLTTTDALASCETQSVETPLEWILLFARTTEYYDESKEAYQGQLLDWERSDIEKELKVQNDLGSDLINQAALIDAWVDAQPGKIDEAVSLIMEYAVQYEGWPDDAILLFIDMVPEEFLEESDKLIELMIAMDVNPKKAVNLSLRSLERIAEFYPVTQEKIVTNVLACIEQEDPRLPEYVGSSQALGNFLKELIVTRSVSTPELLLGLIRSLPEDLIVEDVKQIINSALAIGKDTAHWPILELLINRFPEVMNPNSITRAIDSWQSIWLQDPQAIRDLGVLIKDIPDESERLSDHVLDVLLMDGSVEIIADLEEVNLGDRWSNTILFCQKLLGLKQLGIFDRGYEFKAEQLRWILDAFDWEIDQEQADMAAVTLDKAILGRNLNPNWKTPLARMVEILIAGGRTEQARSIVEHYTGLFIHVAGKQVSANKFISGMKDGERTMDISEDYLTIADLIILASENPEK